MIKYAPFSSFSKSPGRTKTTTTELSNSLDGFNGKFQSRSFDYDNSASWEGLYEDYNALSEPQVGGIEVIEKFLGIVYFLVETVIILLNTKNILN